MKWRLQFTIGSLLVLMLATAIGTSFWIRWNRAYVALPLPMPNSSKFTPAEARKALPHTLRKSIGIQRDHEFVTSWKGPTQSLRVHVQRNGTIRTINYWGEERLGLDALHESVDGVPRWGNAVSVLITSDTDGWDDLPEKQSVVESLFVPGIQVYSVADQRSLPQ